MDFPSNEMQKELDTGFTSCVQTQLWGNIMQPYVTFLVLSFLQEAWREKKKIKEQAEMLCKKQVALFACINLCENEEGFCWSVSPWESTSPCW